MKATGKARHPHDKTRPVPAPIRRALEKNDIKTVALKLTPRQRAFAQEYVVDFNGTAAAIRAGYSTKYADRQASTLLHHEGVATYIDHLTRSKEAKIMSVDVDYVLQKVTAIINKEGVRDGDQLRALELLARHLGMFIDRTELTGKDGGAIEVENRKIEEEAELFIGKLKVLTERADKERATLQ